MFGLIAGGIVLGTAVIADPALVPVQAVPCAPAATFPAADSSDGIPVRRYLRYSDGPTWPHARWGPPGWWAAQHPCLPHVRRAPGTDPPSRLVYDMPPVPGINGRLIPGIDGLPARWVDAMPSGQWRRQWPGPEGVRMPGEGHGRKAGRWPDPVGAPRPGEERVRKPGQEGARRLGEERGQKAGKREVREPGAKAEEKPARRETKRIRGTRAALRFLGASLTVSRVPGRGFAERPSACPALKGTKGRSRRATRVARGCLGKAERRAAEKAVTYAARQLGKPYIWGGQGPRGFDCSGLVMKAYRAAAIAIPRVSFDQWRHGRRVPSGREWPGDLVFFNAGPNSGPGRPGHVGIVINPLARKMIVAPNSGDVIKIATYKRGDLMGFTRPAAR